MPDSVSSDTIESLAGKLADFAEGLDEAERAALDLFFLQPAEVEGFAMSMKPDGPPIAPGIGLGADIFKGGNKGQRQDYYQVRLTDILISSY